MSELGQRPTFTKPRRICPLRARSEQLRFRVEEGEGKAVLDGIEHRIKPGFAILVPAGTRHNIINGPSGPMKLYTLYAPPNHRDGIVHATKADAEVDKEHFDGKTTE